MKEITSLPSHKSDVKICLSWNNNNNSDKGGNMLQKEMFTF